MKGSPSVILIAVCAFCLSSQWQPIYAQINVSVSPSRTDVVVNQARQFIATVSGTADQRVTWSVTGGTTNLGPGVIDPAGLYAAPNKAPPLPFVTIRATSVADPSVVGTALVIVRDVVNFTESNPAEDFFAYNGGNYIKFRWGNLPPGTTKIIFSRAMDVQGAWTEVLINQFADDLTAVGDSEYTGNEFIPPDTGNDYFYKLEAFSATGQLLKSYDPVFLPKSTW